MKKGNKRVPESGDLSVNGIRIRYYDWGGTGDPIVVLHATGFHGRVYRPIVEALTKIGHVWKKLTNVVWWRNNY